MCSLAQFLRNVPLDEMIHDLDRAGVAIAHSGDDDTLDGVTAVVLFLDRLQDVLQLQLSAEP
jgi:hypothetical protein